MRADGLGRQGGAGQLYRSAESGNMALLAEGKDGVIRRE
jgi:hypothetical protein